MSPDTSTPASKSESPAQTRYRYELAWQNLHDREQICQWILLATMLLFGASVSGIGLWMTGVFLIGDWMRISSLWVLGIMSILGPVLPLFIATLHLLRFHCPNCQKLFLVNPRGIPTLSARGACCAHCGFNRNFLPGQKLTSDIQDHNPDIQYQYHSGVVPEVIEAICFLLGELSDLLTFFMGFH